MQKQIYKNDFKKSGKYFRYKILQFVIHKFVK